jgi:hypothetical protein
MNRKAFVAVLACVVVSAVVHAQSVNYDFDRTAKFSGYRTYAWVAGTNVPDALIHQRVVRAIDTQLAQKGVNQVTASDKPDVLVA